MGFFDIPQTQRSPIGILALVLNIIPGGVGSIVAGVVAKSNNTLIIGIIQLVLIIGPYFFMPFAAAIGWIWSLVWGILIFMKSS